MPKVRGLFITGTDTGVGKTYVAAALASWSRAQGINTGVMKPFATGARRIAQRLVSEDALILQSACASKDPAAWVNPSCFREPLAPFVAAVRARKTISLDKAVSAFYRLAEVHDFMIVEGIGGLLVPLTARATLADFAKRLALPVVIVARPGLGTINHTLLTIEAARRAKLKIAGVVFNHGTPITKDPMARIVASTSAEVIRQRGKVAIAGSLPHLHKKSASSLSGWIAQNLNQRWLNRWVG